MTVDGRCDPAFAGVRDVFAENLASGADLGAAVTVLVGGRPVVDLWGGPADKGAARAWQADTACVAFSCTKAVATTAALRLVERGEVDLDAPVATWWPEFAAHGKDGATGTHLLSHQAGLPAFDRPITPAEAADQNAIAAQLAGQEPEWVPGTAHGYHGITFGWLVGELVRRVSGRPIAEAIAADFGLRIAVGPDDDRDIARIASVRTLDPVEDDIAPAETVAALFAAVQSKTSPLTRSTANPPASFNDRVVLAGAWPAAGLVATARELAGFYDRLVRGELLRPETLADATRERVRGPDRTLVMDSAFGLGFMLPNPNMFLPPAARAHAFGHPGASGALGIGDVEAGLAFGYIPNLMRLGVTDRRAYRLVEAVYAAL